jgi:hypothetical protein
MDQDLPITLGDVAEFDRQNMFISSCLNSELTILNGLIVEYCVCKSLNLEKQHFIKDHIRSVLKRIRTKMMDYETAYHTLMSKCNEL